MELSYYPGCALHGSSLDYEMSVHACLARLGIKLRELDDWICCGATAAHALNHKLSLALPARNLGLAEQQGATEMLVPCPMCSAQLLKAANLLAASPALREEMAETVELPVRGTTAVRNLIEIFQRVGLEAIRAATVRTLDEFRPACYYGCLLTRTVAPRFDDCEQPRSMERLLEGLGAAPVDWSFRTECCGAGLTMCDEATVLDLSHKILGNAAAQGANCLVVACPMCHVNLDMKQADVERRYNVAHKLPVYYLSDLVGLALGLGPDVLGIPRHYVAPLAAAAEPAPQPASAT